MQTIEAEVVAGSLDIVTHAITTAYHVTRKRQAIGKKPEVPASMQQGRTVASAEGLDNDLPWEE